MRTAVNTVMKRSCLCLLSCLSDGGLTQDANVVHEQYALTVAAINKTEHRAHLSAECCTHIQSGSDSTAEHHKDVYLLITGGRLFGYFVVFHPCQAFISAKHCKLLQSLFMLTFVFLMLWINS